MATPNDTPPPTRPHLLTFPNSSTNWNWTKVFKCELMEAILTQTTTAIIWKLQTVYFERNLAIWVSKASLCPPWQSPYRGTHGQEPLLSRTSSLPPPHHTCPLAAGNTYQDIHVLHRVCPVLHQLWFSPASPVYLRADPRALYYEKFGYSFLHLKTIGYVSISSAWAQ